MRLTSEIPREYLDQTEGDVGTEGNEISIDRQRITRSQESNGKSKKKPGKKRAQSCKEVGTKKKQKK